MFEIIRTLAGRQAEEGHAVAVAYGLRPETPEYLDALFDDRVVLHAVPWTRRNLSSQIRTAGALRRLQRSVMPDVVHLHSTFAGVVGSLVLRGGAPLIYTPQGYSFSRKANGATRTAFRAVERVVAKRVDLVGACSQDEAAMAMSLRTPTRIVVVPNGIPALDANPPERPRSTAERATVIGMGRLVPQRNPAGAARVLARIADLAELRWIGGGPLDQELVAAGVSISGWLDHAACMTEVRRAQLYLHWTSWDGLPLSIMEAMANDVVVIARDIGPNRELLGPDQVCSTEDDAARLLRWALEDERTYAAMLASQRARRRRFSATTMARGWMQVYEDLIAEVDHPRVLARTSTGHL